MNNIQDLITRAETCPHQTAEHIFLLAEHLAPLAHPLPHPERYDHGYIKVNTFKMPDIAAQSAEVEACRPVHRHPGPITMGEPSGWNWGAITAIAGMLGFWALVYFAKAHK